MEISENKKREEKEHEKILFIPKKIPYERKQKSLVWDYFEKLNATRIRCRLCGVEQCYRGSTWNILRHLKSIHKINATKRAESQQRQQQQVMLKDVKKHKITDDEDQIHANSSCDEYKPVIFQNNAPLVDFDTADMNILYADSDTDCFVSKHRLPKRINSLEDDRIIAETEYFREKAAFFRVQKHLTALQAKKLKYELDQLYMAHDVKYN